MLCAECNLGCFLFIMYIMIMRFYVCEAHVIEEASNFEICMQKNECVREQIISAA